MSLRRVKVAATVMFFISIALPAFTISSVDAQGLRILRHEKQTFDNPDCVKTSTCDLKQFSITVEDYKIIVGGEPAYGTRLFAEFETDIIGNLENYGLVQFIRGCVFESVLLNGKVANMRNISKYQFNEIEMFYFPAWVIDSIDEDPLYWSLGLGPEIKNRLHLYRWNEVKNSFDYATEKIYGLEKPMFPRLYVTDFPGAAFFSENSDAKNISLEFKMCIYKSGDIPKTASEDKTNFAEPIHCFSWDSSHIYNHSTGVFERKTELDPFCR